MRKYLSSLLFALSCIVTNGESQTPTFISDSLESYIKKGMQDWDIPGLSVVIVKDGKTVFIKGYGVKDLDTKEPVTENTTFLIASNTKLFTGTALAMLEHRGKLALNDRVRRYLPKFKLYDSAASELVTIRDLLSHRIGTKTFQGDFTFLDSKLSRREIINRMSLLKPSAVFRQDFGYCNSCFLAAGEIIPSVSRIPWEVFVYDSLVAPLGMKSTSMSTKGLDLHRDIASPYTSSFSKTLVKLPFDQWDNLGPAASMVSNVTDLSHWLLCQLNDGQYDGREIIPPAVIAKTRRINTMLSEQKREGFPTRYTGYGLGLFTTAYNGAQVYWHTGGALGMVSNVCFVPDKKLGIAILTNNDNQAFFENLRYQILDAYLQQPFVNRSALSLKGFKEEASAEMKRIDSLQARVKGKSPLPLTAFTGVYSNPLYGRINIEATGSGLKINFENHPSLTASLSYMNGDEWLVRYNIIAYGVFPVKFVTENGKIKSVILKVNDFIEYDPYVFEKN